MTRFVAPDQVAKVDPLSNALYLSVTESELLKG